MIDYLFGLLYVIYISVFTFARIIIIIIKKNVRNARMGELFTPYQSEDPSPTRPTNRKKEEKRKATEDKKGASWLGQ